MSWLTHSSGPFIQKAPYPGTELFRWGVDGARDALRHMALLQRVDVVVRRGRRYR